MSYLERNLTKGVKALYPKHYSTRLKETEEEGSLGGAAVWRLPLAQGAIPETRDRIPRRAPGAWSMLLLPMSLPLSLSVTIINKFKK